MPSSALRLFCRVLNNAECACENPGFIGRSNRSARHKPTAPKNSTVSLRRGSRFLSSSFFCFRFIRCPGFWAWFQPFLGQVFQKRFPPFPHGVDDRFQSLAALRDRIFHLWGNHGVNLSFDYSVPLQFAQLQRKHTLSRPWNKSTKFPVSLCPGEKDEEEFSFPLPPDDFSRGLNGAAQTVIASMSHRVFFSFRNILDTIAEFCAYLSEPIILHTFM